MVEPPSEVGPTKGWARESVATTEGKMECSPVVWVRVARPPGVSDEKSFHNVANGRARCTIAAVFEVKKEIPAKRGVQEARPSPVI